MVSESFAPAPRDVASFNLLPDLRQRAVDLRKLSLDAQLKVASLAVFTDRRQAEQA